SSDSGDRDRRTTCTDEMLATPFTAWPAMRVKSGPPSEVLNTGAAIGRAGAAVGGSAGCAVSARDSVAVRMRPVRTRPAVNPARSRTQESRSLRIMTLQFADFRLQIYCRWPI